MSPVSEPPTVIVPEVPVVAVKSSAWLSVMLVTAST